MFTCDEIIDVERLETLTTQAKSYDEETKTVPTNFNEKKVTFKTKNDYILPAFLLITIALLIGVSIYYYHIKQQSKYLHL